MTKCLIVDDEPVAQRIIASYLDEIPDMEVVGCCINAIEAMTFMENHMIDLLFLDIEMPKIKGLDFLKSLHHPPAVILTTAHREFALDAFDLGVVDYLLKPIPFERFFQAINKFKKEHQAKHLTESKDFLLLKSDRKTYRITPTDILYIEGMSNYIRVFLEDKQLMVYDSLTAMEKQLPSPFLRIHKSYIINTLVMDAFSHECVEIRGKKIAIGGVYKKEVLAILNGL